MQLPASDKRLTIVGSTGTGKTQAGVWHLSQTDFELGRPWIIIDFKRDKLIREIGANEISVTGAVPIKPGLYVVRPLHDQQEDVTNFLWRCWAQENLGLYFDEGYMIDPRNPAFNALLTQGRSKKIQMITLSQRPAWMSRFVFSEADYFQIFRLNDKRDYINLKQMISIDIVSHLPQYHSRYYDVAGDTGVILAPVPGRQELINSFRKRLKKKVSLI